MRRFKLGNLLRGGFAGDFETIEEAWEKLGSRFLLSFPCDAWSKERGVYINEDGGRHVYMYVKEENKYGHLDWAMCKGDVFYMKDRVPVTADDYEYCRDAEFF
ncbi:hypothetical protein OLCHANIL_00156 [Vibrio phage V05]|nr:hypothetical protein OLCHANIL_00156 [Vibrio phage V05]WOL24706.1 hypothetical protein [Vibrio phage PG216]